MTYKQVKYFMFVIMLISFSFPLLSCEERELKTQPTKVIKCDFLSKELLELRKQLFQEATPSKRKEVNNWRWVTVVVHKPVSCLFQFYNKPFEEGGKEMSFVTRREVYEGKLNNIDSMGPNAEGTDDVIFSQAKVVRVTTDNKNAGLIGFELIVLGLDKNNLLRIIATEDVSNTDVSLFVYLEEGWTPIFKAPIDMQFKEYPINW